MKRKGKARTKESSLCTCLCINKLHTPQNMTRWYLMPTHLVKRGRNVGERKRKKSIGEKKKGVEKKGKERKLPASSFFFL